eukprot:COSAG06_NODE_42601_length_380_cov_0.740214_1_plen_104_part_01
MNICVAAVGGASSACVGSVGGTALPLHLLLPGAQLSPQPSTPKRKNRGKITTQRKLEAWAKKQLAVAVAVAELPPSQAATCAEAAPPSCNSTTVLELLSFSVTM